MDEYEKKIRRIKIVFGTLRFVFLCLAIIIFGARLFFPATALEISLGFLGLGVVCYFLNEMFKEIESSWVMKVRMKFDRCYKCGYDLRSSGNQCPECGHYYSPVDWYPYHHWPKDKRRK